MRKPGPFSPSPRSPRSLPAVAARPAARGHAPPFSACRQRRGTGARGGWVRGRGVKSGLRGSVAGPLPPPRAAETALTEAWRGLWWLWVSPSLSPCTRGRRSAGCRACGARAGAGAQCVGQRECICGAVWDASPAVQTDFNFKW